MMSTEQWYEELGGEFRGVIGGVMGGIGGLDIVTVRVVV